MAEIETEQRRLSVIAQVAKLKLAKVSSQVFARVANLPATLRRGETVEPIMATAGGSGGSLLRKSLLWLVLAPTVLFAVYTAFWQSEGYVAEARLTVRAAQERPASMADPASFLGKLTGGAKNTQQDSYIILNYIRSHAIIIDLGGRTYLETVFSRPDGDYFSRLKKGRTIEDLLQYWSKHIIASVDTVSGILTVKVIAFTPEDALRVSQDIIQQSEKLVNAISLRNRRDALARAEDEVALSARNLAEARQKTLQFRNENVLIDPASRAAGLSELIGKLTVEKLEIENTLATLSSSLSSDAPSQRFQRGKLDTLNQQIDTLKASLTNLRGDDTVSAQMATFERLKLDEQFAEKIYSIAQNASIRARQELNKQQLFLVTVVAPTLPESATYPKVAANILLLLASLFVLWAIGALIGATINDQMV
jgi:capsular polysaccharide transport system permease protein